MKTKKSVVLVHGLWMNSLVMRYFGWYFRWKKYKVYYFGYPSMRNHLQQNVDKLAELIQRIPPETTSLVGHSLGGILCIEYLRQHEPINIDRCLLLGTPIRGSQIARHMSGKKWGQAMLGNSVNTLTADYSDKLDKRFGIIIGTGSKGLGQLFGPLQSPHDGAVSFHEAVPPDHIKRIVLPTSHSSMLLSRSVARAAVSFCDNGEFPEDIRVR